MATKPFAAALRLLTESLGLRHLPILVIDVPSTTPEPIREQAAALMVEVERFLTDDAWVAAGRSTVHASDLAKPH